MEAVAPSRPQTGATAAVAAIAPLATAGRPAAGGGRQQALKDGICCGGTPIRSPRAVQRLWLSGLGAPALLSTRAGDAGGQEGRRRA
jgi:hypothetical protein